MRMPAYFSHCTAVSRELTGALAQAGDDHLEVAVDASASRSKSRLPSTIRPA
jgi:hypothetical protein